MPLYAVAMRDTDAGWGPNQAVRIKGPRGSIHAIPDALAERFTREFADRPSEFTILDDATAVELIAERDAAIAEREAARAAEAEAARLAAEREAERVRRRDELRELVREAASAAGV